MEKFNAVPDKGTFGGSVEVVNQNFLLAQQEMEVLQNKCENESARAIEAENSLRQLYNNLQQSQPVPVTALPATGEAGKIYRLAGTNSYADYMYSEDDLSTPLKMAEYNNGIDSKPTAGSKNFVESGGVEKSIIGLVPVNSSDELLDKGLILINKSCTAQGVVQDYDGWCVSPLIKVKTDIPLWINTYNLYIYNLDSETSFYKYPYSLEGRPLNSISSSISAEYCNVRLEFRIDDIDTVRVGLTEKKNLVKDYFDYDNKLTVDSNALVPSGVLQEIIDGGNSLNPGNNEYAIEAGKTYKFKNVGTGIVNLFYKVNASSEEVAIKSNLQIGESYDYEASVNAEIVIISNYAGAKVIIYSPDAIIPIINSLSKDVEVLNGELGKSEISEDLHGGDNNYNIIAGSTYIFENTGSATVSVYYQLDAQSPDVLIYQNLPIGESFEYIPSVNASIIAISNVPGAKITVTKREVGELVGKVEALEKEPILMRVATFNTGDYTGKNLSSNEAIMAYRKLVGELGANIIGTQEDIANFGGADIGNTFWKMYKYYQRKGIYNLNFKAFASDYKIDNVREVNYVGSYTYRHIYFLAGELRLRDKVILVTSFHFDWSDNDTRRDQIRQIIEYASTYNYVIMLGDTNCDNYVDTQPREPRNLHDVEWAIFSNAGYDMANDGYFGIFNTVGYDYEEGKQDPLDNIFIKGNITLRNAGIIVKDWTNDHCVLYADLAIY